jgi:fucose permease
LVTNYNFLIIFISFGILCGLASTVTSMLPQIVSPYGISYDDAGFLGVAFIVAGIVGAVGTGIFIDRTKLHKWVLRVYVPIVGFMYLALLMVGKSLADVPPDLPPLYLTNLLFSVYSQKG